MVNMFGLTKPENIQYNVYQQVNLINSELNYAELLDSDMIIYAAGAGIQSNLKENAELIYNLNVSVPVRICNNLKLHGYNGAFVSFGSYFELGENTTDHCFDEIELLSSQRKVVNDYSVSKRMFSTFISSAEMPYTTLHYILPTIHGEK